MQRQRGSILLVAVIMTAVLAVVAVALIRRLEKATESAAAKRHYDTAVACADGARELLISQFRTFGVRPTDLILNEVVGSSDEPGSRRYASGHYDQFGVKSVEVVPAEMFASSGEAAMDIANRTAATRLGGAFYRITVVCSDPREAARQSEVEFLVRFGL